MTEKDLEQLKKDISAHVTYATNGFYTIDIYYKGKVIKTIEQ